MIFCFDAVTTSPGAHFIQKDAWLTQSELPTQLSTLNRVLRTILGSAHVHAPPVATLTWPLRPPSAFMGHTDRSESSQRPSITLDGLTIPLSNLTDSSIVNDNGSKAMSDPMLSIVDPMAPWHWSLRLVIDGRLASSHRSGLWRQLTIMAGLLDERLKHVLISIFHHNFQTHAYIRS